MDPRYIFVSVPWAQQRIIYIYLLLRPNGAVRTHQTKRTLGTTDHTQLRRKHAPAAFAAENALTGRLFSPPKEGFTHKKKHENIVGDLIAHDAAVAGTIRDESHVTRACFGRGQRLASTTMTMTDPPTQQGRKMLKSPYHPPKPKSNPFSPQQGKCTRGTARRTEGVFRNLTQSKTTAK